MKKKVMLEVADKLEAVMTAPKKPKHDIGFNMCSSTPKEARDIERIDHSPHHCTMIMCLAGWTVLFLNGRRALRTTSVRIEEKAKKLLGLTNAEASALFEPAPGWRADLTHNDAIATLRLAAVTDKVEWVRVRPIDSF